ncbi:MAG TPA: VWA domain-containing protein [Candidatus Hydrogenedentes bacterium]|jgi:Ca-activated chloride channel family protein|nr:VWA domain-containing protein [Candidatus Hydrogenedentota bacterium]HPJ99572.1 VWA domain-containing protein [Candidatus Hydrogenedentota bacterium]
MNWLQINTFMHPRLLLLAPLVILLLALESFARAPGTISISTGETLRRVGSAKRAVLRRLPAFLRALALLLLLVALARPLKGLQPRLDRADVVDIMLCVDVSGSMAAQDFESRGARKNRLEVTKDAVRDFIESRKQKPGDRYGLDRLGLILYAGYAWTQCPLTLDYGVLDRELELASINERDPRKQGTAIGSAIGLAASRLRKSEARTKVIILLTDGLNNSGELDPITAARLAQEYGIRIYTIGAGSQGEVLVPRRSLWGNVMMPAQMPIDEESLQKIAEITGGRFYRATDTKSLIGAYEEINELEATEIEIGDYYEYEEGFFPWALFGGALMCAAVISRRLWFEPIP